MSPIAEQIGRDAAWHLETLRREAAIQRLVREGGEMNQARALQPTGITGFSIVWLGQLVSLLGSGMTTFALTIWAWQVTGQATALALVGFFSFVPTILLSPFAGVLIDRWSRKRVMMLSDLGAGLSTIVTLILYTTGNLEIWHLYALGAWSGLVGTFQLPAFSAAITMMVAKKHYARANGMRSLANSISHIGAPVLAGILLAFSDLASILIIDIVTFSFAVLMLLIVYIPQPSRPVAEPDELTGLWREAMYGFHYIFSRKSVLGLTLTFTSINLFGMLGLTLFAAMILARTGNNEVVLGSVQSALGVGGVVGGLFISFWGGPKHKVYGVLLGVLGGSLSLIGMGLGQGFSVWALSAFSMFFFFPMLDAFAGAIYQSKVPPHVQGKFFSAGLVLSHTGTTLAYLLAGPLADYVFEPAMMPGGVWADDLSWLVGIGPGAGMSLMFVIAGILGVLVAIVAYLYKPVREIETLLPDHELEATAKEEEKDEETVGYAPRN